MTLAQVLVQREELKPPIAQHALALEKFGLNKAFLRLREAVQHALEKEK